MPAILIASNRSSWKLIVLTANTLRSHLRSVYEKLQVNLEVELVSRVRGR